MRVIPGRLSRIVRRFLRAPSFTTIAVLTLALGIGANTAIFSVIRGVLLKPLPFAEPDSLIAVWHTAPGLNLKNLELSAATYFTYREEGRVFEDIGLWNTSAVSVTGTGEPERVQALVVTDGLLGVLRVAPHIGRLFTRERRPAPHPGARDLLTHGYWQRKFGRDPVGDRAADRRGRDTRARSSACCRRTSGSSTSGHNSSCRSGSIAPPSTSPASTTRGSPVSSPARRSPRPTPTSPA